jgi:hypothetical protein
MSVARFGLGLALAAICVAPLVWGAVAARRSLLPAWNGAPARLAECVLALTGVILVLEALGLVGLLKPLPVALGCLAAGAAMAAAAARVAGGGGAGAPAPAPAAPAPDRLQVVAAQIGCAVVAGAWATRLIPALGQGMTGSDTVWYHLPQAAGFVQEGSITHVQFFETGAGTAFYPATSGLIHALGMLWMGNDFLSPFVNFGWLALALLAAWCIGRPYGKGPLCLLGATLLLATPVMVETQPGGAYNDLVGLALLLASAAFLLNGDAAGRAGLLAALAAGPTLGTKLTMVAPIALLAVGVVAIVPAGARRPVALTWAAALLTLGGLWYVRNLVAFGNPVPAAGLELGPISLPSPPLTELTYAPVHYFGQDGVWRETFLPGLRDAFGPVWWALLGLAAAGMVAAALGTRGRVVRVLGLVALVSGIAVIFTPQGLGTQDDPLFFKFNLRYPTPALVLGLVLLPLAPRLERGRARALLPGVLLAVLALTQLDPTIWPTELREGRFAEPPSSGTALGGLAIGAALLAAALLATSPSVRAGLGGRRTLAALAGVAALVAAVGGYVLQRHYLDQRYTDYEPMPEVAAWARDAEDARIGIAGFFVQYPLYGLDLSNRVDYVARHGPHGAFTRIDSCRDWRRALNEGGYEYVVTTPFNYPGNLRGDQPDEAGWTGSDAAARLVLRDRRLVSLYRLSGRLDPAACRE